MAFKRRDGRAWSDYLGQSKCRLRNFFKDSPTPGSSGGAPVIGSTTRRRMRRSSSSWRSKTRGTITSSSGLDDLAQMSRRLAIGPLHAPALDQKRAKPAAEHPEPLGFRDQIAFGIVDRARRENALINLRCEEIECQIETLGMRGAGLERDAMRGVGRSRNRPLIGPGRRHSGSETLPAAVSDAVETPVHRQSRRAGFHVLNQTRLFFTESLETGREKRRGTVFPELEIGTEGRGPHAEHFAVESLLGEGRRHASAIRTTRIAASKRPRAPAPRGRGWFSTPCRSIRRRRVRRRNRCSRW